MIVLSCIILHTIHMSTCRQCNATFEVFARDLAFYDKVAPVFAGKKYPVPPPTLCPACRQQRRFTFRNERNLYRRKCDGSGKEIISMYAPNTPFPVYSQEVWWQGNWDGTAYGRDFDFSRPFFEQFHELTMVTPRIALLNVNGENSNYCNFTGDVKNSYLIFGSVYSQDCYYGSPYYSTDCVDTLVVRECELCYECVDCRKLYNCTYCQDCNSSNSLVYCKDLQGCAECIGCVGLRNVKFCIFNEQLTEEDYKKRKQEFDLCDAKVHTMLQKKLEVLSLERPHRYAVSMNSENVSGSHVFHSKDTSESFFADRCHDCAYCAQVIDLKDCYDCNYVEEGELCYEYFGMYGVRQMLFSYFLRNVTNSIYSEFCVSCDNLFGCSNLKNKSYCILNKQYSKEDYERLVPKIIEHMKKDGERTARARSERGSGSASPSEAEPTKEWGEFFPAAISPFAFNETVASEYFPLSKEDVLARGWRWREEDQKEYQPQTIKIPERIQDVRDDICYEILACEVTGKNYRIVPQELAFYRRMGLPIPRKHPDQRHLERIQKRNPRQLWKRACDKCGTTVHTSYAPERPEKVYCEECYLEELY